MNLLAKLVGGLCLVVGTIVLFAMLLALPTYFLWNWLMPTIFGIKTITLFQALGISLLSGCLFRSSVTMR